mmetsp:Transcript_8012/g.24962  ORF Transcript_8012/g.24962 Transcript_8012/m.24962 type:complete len:150 (+) Transcript_8012:508-957(+)
MPPASGHISAQGFVAESHHRREPASLHLCPLFLTNVGLDLMRNPRPRHTCLSPCRRLPYMSAAIDPKSITATEERIGYLCEFFASKMLGKNFLSTNRYAAAAVAAAIGASSAAQRRVLFTVRKANRKVSVAADGHASAVLNRDGQMYVE